MRSSRTSPREAGGRRSRPIGEARRGRSVREGLAASDEVPRPRLELAEGSGQRTRLAVGGAPRELRSARERLSHRDGPWSSSKGRWVASRPPSFRRTFAVPVCARVATTGCGRCGRRGSLREAPQGSSLIRPAHQTAEGQSRQTGYSVSPAPSTAPQRPVILCNDKANYALQQTVAVGRPLRGLPRAPAAERNVGRTKRRP